MSFVKRILKLGRHRGILRDSSEATEVKSGSLYLLDGRKLFCLFCQGLINPISNVEDGARQRKFRQGKLLRDNCNSAGRKSLNQV